MNIEHPEKFLAQSGCAKQDVNTDTSITPTSPDPAAPPNGQPPASQCPKRPSRIVFIVSGWWYMELLCIFLSFAVFGFYYWCLAYINGKPEGQPGIFSTIYSLFNSFPSALSQISVVLKLLMFVPVTSAMGQLSWYRFWDAASRPVADLQAFDAASRGLSGSVKLLLSSHIGDSLHTTLGAILTIAALYIGSAMQNAIYYNNNITATVPMNKPTGDQNATIPFVDLFDHHPPTDVTIIDERNITTDPELEVSLYSAWLYNMSPRKPTAPVASLPLYCTEEVCEWDKYTTLVAQSQCQSVPATVGSDGIAYSDRANINSSVSASGSGNVSVVPALLKFQTSTTIPKNSSFTALFPDQSVVIIHLAAIANFDFRGVVAAECVLHWQVQHIPKIRATLFDTGQWTYSPSNSTPYTTIKPGQSADGNEFLFEAPCNSDHGGDNCDYRVNRNAAVELQRPLGEFFQGYVLTDSLDDSRLKAFGKAMDVFARSWVDSAGLDLRKSLTLTLEDYMSNVATAITGYIIATATKVSTGTTGALFVYRIRWYYMVYPGVMLVVSTYILLYAMWKTRRMPVWKTSLLPFLYHGFQNTAIEDVHDLSHLAWMQEASKSRIVALRDEHDGHGLKLRDSRRDNNMV